MPKVANPLANKRLLSSNLFLTIVVLLVAVLVIGGILLSNRGTAQRATPQGGAAQGGGQVASEVLLRPNANTLLEAPEAKVTVVEFLDYQCPSCAGYYRNITKQLERDYAGRVTFVTRGFPLDMHPLAVPAARAAEAAAMQGKYRAMYHKLFDNYRAWALNESGNGMSSDLERAGILFDKWARQIGLNPERFHEDMNSDKVAQRIERDRADGRKAGVSGTPTFFVNGKKFTPDGQSYQEVETQLRARLDEALAA